MILAKGVKYYYSKTFGNSLKYEVNSDTVILCTNNGTGWVPQSFILPHQVYVETLKKLFSEGAHVIVAFPIMADPVLLAYANQSFKKGYEVKKDVG